MSSMKPSIDDADESARRIDQSAIDIQDGNQDFG
jgi:hypothetical protein